MSDNVTPHHDACNTLTDDQRTFLEQRDTIDELRFCADLWHQTRGDHVEFTPAMKAYREVLLAEKRARLAKLPERKFPLTLGTVSESEKLFWRGE